MHHQWACYTALPWAPLQMNAKAFLRYGTPTERQKEGKYRQPTTFDFLLCILHQFLFCPFICQHLYGA